MMRIEIEAADDGGLTLHCGCGRKARAGVTSFGKTRFECRKHGFVATMWMIPDRTTARSR